MLSFGTSGSFLLKWGILQANTNMAPSSSDVRRCRREKEFWSYKLVNRTHPLTLRGFEGYIFEITDSLSHLVFWPPDVQVPSSFMPSSAHPCLVRGRSVGPCSQSSWEPCGLLPSGLPYTSVTVIFLFQSCYLGWRKNKQSSTIIIIYRYTKTTHPVVFGFKSYSGL